MNAEIHARNSARKYGGSPTDYLYVGAQKKGDYPIVGISTIG